MLHDAGRSNRYACFNMFTAVREIIGNLESDLKCSVSNVK